MTSDGASPASIESPEPPPRSPPAWVTLATCIALALATLAVYAQTFQFGLVDLDDHGYVGDDSGSVREGLTPANVRWALTTTAMANWHPLTWLSYMLDRTIAPEGWAVFHVTNVVLHVLATLLVFGVWRLMSGCHWPSALVAALFALHPAHVESVAWISERKDTLSAVFMLLTMWAYVRYVRAPGRGIGWYALMMTMFALGLMAKSMLVTLPCVLLLMDVWPLRRIDPSASAGQAAARFVRLAIEKIPLFIMVAAASFMTFRAQQGMSAMMDVGVRFRAVNAAISYVRYVQMLVWPVDLCAFYEMPGTYLTPSPPPWLFALCAGMLALLTLAAIAAWRRVPVFTFGWLWFVGMLVPVIGLFVQVGSQAMADRYTYLPYLGLFTIIAWGLRGMIVRRIVPPPLVSAFALAWLAALGATSWKQTAVWRDTDALCTHGLRVSPGNYRMHGIYGDALVRQERFAEAQLQFEAQIALWPNDPAPLISLGKAHLAQDAANRAIAAFERALTIDADNAEAHLRTGEAHLRLGDERRALTCLERALALDPGNVALQQLVDATRNRLDRR